MSVLMKSSGPHCFTYLPPWVSQCVSVLHSCCVQVGIMSHELFPIGIIKEFIAANVLYLLGNNGDDLQE